MALESLYLIANQRSNRFKTQPMTVSLSLSSGLNNNIPRITEIAISVICSGTGGAKIDFNSCAWNSSKLTFDESIFHKLGQYISTKRHLCSQHRIENNSTWPGINPPRIVSGSSDQYFGCSVNCGATECWWEGILFHRTRKTEIAKF